MPPIDGANTQDRFTLCSSPLSQLLSQEDTPLHDTLLGTPPIDAGRTANGLASLQIASPQQHLGDEGKMLMDEMALRPIEANQPVVADAESSAYAAGASAAHRVDDLQKIVETAHKEQSGEFWSTVDSLAIPNLAIGLSCLGKPKMAAELALVAATLGVKEYWDLMEARNAQSAALSKFGDCSNDPIIKSARKIHEDVNFYGSMMRKVAPLAVAGLFIPYTPVRYGSLAVIFGMDAYAAYKAYSDKSVLADADRSLFTSSIAQSDEATPRDFLPRAAC